MSADFGYINARVRGQKSRLLGPEFYAQALADADFSAFTATLSQTDYMSDLEEAQSRTDGLTAVDQALARNFWRTTRQILNYSDGWPHRLVAMLLMKYDLANIKAIVRAKHADRPAEDTLTALLPAGDLKPAVLEQMAQAADVPAVAQVLSASGHPLAPEVRQAAKAYQEDGDLFNFELAVDRAYARTMLETAQELPLPKGFRDWIILNADATNVRTALKLRGREVPAADLFIDTGKAGSFRRSAFDTLIADVDGAGLDQLNGGPFAAVAGIDSLSAADGIIRDILDERVRKLALGDPLGPFVVLDYLRRKERETARLRLLARGKFYSVPRAQLETELGIGNA